MVWDKTMKHSAASFLPISFFMPCSLPHFNLFTNSSTILSTTICLQHYYYDHHYTHTHTHTHTQNAGCQILSFFLHQRFILFIFVRFCKAVFTQFFCTVQSYSKVTSQFINRWIKTISGENIDNRPCYTVTGRIFIWSRESSIIWSRT